MLTAETAKVRRIDELSRDPQTGKQNPKAKKEAEAIMQAEGEGIFSNARRPDLEKGEPNIDFKTDQGWVEIKAAVDPAKRPILRQAADVASHTKVQGAEYFLVDLKELSSAGKSIYKSELQNAGADMSKVRFIND
ncbi:MAG: hypothetical protein U1F76_09070 [Candidatus Competibacteraceae bacterium]